MNPSPRREFPESVNETVRGVRLDRAGPVATMWLCRPTALDASGADVLLAMRQLGRGLPGDVRVVVVDGESMTGSVTGDSDLGRGQGTPCDPTEVGNSVGLLTEVTGWLGQPDLISIAVIRGDVAGIGVGLALACDLRVFAIDARMVIDEILRGSIPCLGGTKRLVELVGYPRALELCLTGQPVDAAAAQRLGLASVVVPASEVDAAVSSLVERALAPQRDAVVEVKALLLHALERSDARNATAERDAAIRRAVDVAQAVTQSPLAAPPSTPIETPVR